MSAAGLAELGLSLPSAAASSPVADVDMLSDEAAVKAEEAAPKDLYTQLKESQRELEFLRIQEAYIKDESKHLKRELLRAKEEVKRIQSVPLIIGQFIEMIDDVHGIVSSTAGQNHYVRILSTINRELLKPNTSVALHRYSNSLVDTLPNEADSAISMMQMTEKPDTSYADIGQGSETHGARSVSNAVKPSAHNV